MRLDKFICKSTELTKYEAVKAIHTGQVIVNNKYITTESVQVHENNIVTLNGQRLKIRDYRYIMMHKPLGTISSNIDEAYPSIFNCIDIDRASELHIVGRLDKDTTGLVLLTDNGRWSFNMISPKSQCKKVYRVGLRDAITPYTALKFKNGIQLQEEKKLTLPAELNIISSKEVLLTITEGKYHQVKRMFAAVGNRVISLHREKIGAVNLDIGIGQWRHLTSDEVNSFNK